MQSPEQVEAVLLYILFLIPLRMKILLIGLSRMSSRSGRSSCYRKKTRLGLLDVGLFAECRSTGRRKPECKKQESDNKIKVEVVQLARPVTPSLAVSLACYFFLHSTHHQLCAQFKDIRGERRRRHRSGTDMRFRTSIANVALLHSKAISFFPYTMRLSSTPSTRSENFD